MGASQSRSRTAEAHSSPKALFEYANTIKQAHAAREDAPLFDHVDTGRASALSRYEIASNDGDDLALRIMRDILILNVALAIHRLGELHAGQRAWPTGPVAKVVKAFYAGSYDAPPPSAAGDVDLMAATRGLRLLFVALLNLIREGENRLPRQRRAAPSSPAAAAATAAAAPSSPVVPLTDSEILIGLLAARHAAQFYTRRATTPFAAPDLVARVARTGRVPVRPSERLEIIRFVRNATVALLQTVLDTERAAIAGSRMEGALKTALQLLAEGYFNCDTRQPDPAEPEVRYHLALTEVCAALFLRSYTNALTGPQAANVDVDGDGIPDIFKFRDQFMFDINNAIAWLTHWKSKYIPPDSNEDDVVALDDDVKALRIVVFGDVGTQGDSNQYNTLAAIKNFLDAARDAGDTRLPILVHLGDIYYSGTIEEAKKFEDCYHATWPDKATRPALWSIAGNHEYRYLYLFRGLIVAAWRVAPFVSCPVAHTSSPPQPFPRFFPPTGRAVTASLTW